MQIFPFNKSRLQFLFALIFIGDFAHGATYYESALDLFANGDFAATNVELRNAIRERPDNVAARVLMGRSLLAQGLPREAMAELEQALALGGDDNLVLILLGQVYMQVLEPKKVLTSIIPPGKEQAVDGEIHLLHGDAALQLGDFGYATESFQHASQKLPGDARPVVGAARVALARGRDAVADELLADALELDKTSVEGLTLSGLVARDRGRDSDALEALSNALKHDPDALKALGARAALYLDRGEIEKAQTDLSRLLTLNPIDLEGLHLQSWIMISEGRGEAAREFLREKAEVFRELEPSVIEKLPQLQLFFGVESYLFAEYEQAIEIFEDYLGRYPQHNAAKRYLAASYLGIGDWDKVIRVLNPRPGEDLPEDLSILSVLAEAFRAKGNASRAIALYQKALELSPDSAGYALALADSQFALGNRAHAVMEMEKLIVAFPDFREAQIHIIGMYLDVGRTADALEVAEKLERKYPNDAAIQNVVGSALMQSGAYIRAGKKFDLAVAQEPSFLVAKLNRARLLIKQGQTSKAGQLYEELIANAPGFTTAIHEYATLRLEAGDTERARQLLQSILERNPSHFAARVTRLWILLADNKLEELRNEIATLEQIAEDNAELQIVLAQVYVALGDFGNGNLMLRRAAQNAGFNADLLHDIAVEQLAAIGDAANAMRSVSKAIEAHPRHLDALSFRVIILLAQDKVNDARARLEELKALYPNHAKTFLVEGDIARHAGRHDLAVSAYTTAYRLAPSHVTVTRLSGAQVSAGAFDDALKTIRIWILTHPDDLEARHGLAEKLLLAGEYRKAQLVYQGILKRNENDPAALNNIAFAAHKAGDKNALGYAERALQLHPEHPGFLDTYGLILAETGQPERGLEILRDAYTRQSTNEEIRYHIALALVQLRREAAAKRELDAALSSGRTFKSRDAARKLHERLSAAN